VRIPTKNNKRLNFSGERILREMASLPKVNQKAPVDVFGKLTFWKLTNFPGICSKTLTILVK
jgi:hypothetical protein